MLRYQNSHIRLPTLFAVILPTIIERRRIDGLLQTRTWLLELITGLTLYDQECSWPLNCIYLCGFSHGAIVAVDLAMHIGSLPITKKDKRPNRLGGVVAVSGSILPELRISEPLHAFSMF